MDREKKLSRIVLHQHQNSLTLLEKSGKQIPLDWKALQDFLAEQTDCQVVEQKSLRLAVNCKEKRLTVEKGEFSSNFYPFPLAGSAQNGEATAIGASRAVGGRRLCRQSEAPPQTNPELKRKSDRVPRRRKLSNWRSPELRSVSHQKQPGAGGGPEAQALAWLSGQQCGIVGRWPIRPPLLASAKSGVQIRCPYSRFATVDRVGTGRNTSKARSRQAEGRFSWRFWTASRGRFRPARGMPRCIQANLRDSAFCGSRFGEVLASPDSSERPKRDGLWPPSKNSRSATGKAYGIQSKFFRGHSLGQDLQGQ